MKERMNESLVQEILERTVSRPCTFEHMAKILRDEYEIPAVRLEEWCAAELLPYLRFGDGKRQVVFNEHAVMATLCQMAGEGVKVLPDIQINEVSEVEDSVLDREQGKQLAATLIEIKKLMYAESFDVDFLEKGYYFHVNVPGYGKYGPFVWDRPAMEVFEVIRDDMLVKASEDGEKQ